MAEGDTSTNKDPKWVTLQSASEQSGIAISTLRNWHRRGLIDARREREGKRTRTLVRRDQVLARVRDEDPGAPSQGGSAETTSGSLPSDPLWTDLIRELGQAYERTGRAEAQVELLSRQVAELSARAAERSRLEILEKENRLLREELERTRGEVREARGATRFGHRR